MERFFTLDADTANIFSELHPDKPSVWYKNNTVAQGVLMDGKPAALIIGTISTETLWIDWLYVKEEFRGNNIGSMLLNRFLQCVSNYGGDYLVHVACGDDLKDYLWRAGISFPDTPEYTTYTTTLSSIKSIPISNSSKGIYTLPDFTRQHMNMINNLFMTTPSIPIGIELPFTPAGYLPESALFIKDDQLKAMLLLKEIGDTIDVSYAYTSPNEPDKLLRLLTCARNALTEHFGGDKAITATALNRKAEDLIIQLFPEADKQNVWEGEFSALSF